MEAAYNASKSAMGTAYATSGNATASEYLGWTRFNTAPYGSATHGGRMVNNYSNDIGAGEYGKFEDIGTMPVGSIIAKDSLVFDKNEMPSAGPLFLMEKMPAGFMSDYGDWKYTMIMPNGSVWGETLGKNSGGMQFCIDCHFAAEDYDYLFFLPSENRK